KPFSAAVRTQKMPSNGFGVTFEQPRLFETRVLTALGGAALAGAVFQVLAALSTQYPFPFPMVVFPGVDPSSAFAFSAAAMWGASVAAWPGGRKAKVWGALFSGGALLVPSLLGVHPSWRLALGAGAVGALWARAQALHQDSAWSGQRKDSWI